MGRGRRRMTAARVTVAVGDHPGWGLFAQGLGLTARI